MNHKHKSAALLRYRRDVDNAPILLGIGHGDFAQRIINIAREHDIEIIKNPDLLAAIEHLKPGSQIPEHLFMVMAEVFAFLYQLREQRQESVRRGLA